MLETCGQGLASHDRKEGGGGGGREREIIEMKMCERCGSEPCVHRTRERVYHIPQHRWHHKPGQGQVKARPRTSTSTQVYNIVPALGVSPEEDVDANYLPYSSPAACVTLGTSTRSGCSGMCSQCESFLSVGSKKNVEQYNQIWSVAAPATLVSLFERWNRTASALVSPASLARAVILLSAHD